MLVTMSELLKDAKANKYAVAAFNFHNLEILRAVVEAAEEAKAPIIVQATPFYMNHMGFKTAAAMVKAAAEEAVVPIAINLDHANGLQPIMQALLYGFSSVMVDGSSLPFAENVKLTQQVVALARMAGASIEAELGHIGGVEDVEEVKAQGGLADPAEAEIFVKETGIDALAPAIGTAHGIYKSEPKLDFERLADISRRTELPLVLHGGSGLDAEQVKKAISLGVAKVNIGTEFKMAWSGALKEFFNQGGTEPAKGADLAKAAIREVAKRKITMFS